MQAQTEPIMMKLKNIQGEFMCECEWKCGKPENQCPSLP